MRPFTPQVWFSLTFVAATLTSLAYLGFRQVSMRSMQAEARLLLSYMETLQSVYHIEQGQYARFDQPYGAPIQGEDHCQQPLGAAQLGFVIRGCHDLRAPPPRYAYRSLLPSDGRLNYRLEAEAGSDKSQQSLVCFDPQGREFWVAEQNKAIVAIQSCW